MIAYNGHYHSPQADSIKLYFFIFHTEKMRSSGHFREMDLIDIFTDRADYSRLSIHSAGHCGLNSVYQKLLGRGSLFQP